MLSQFPLPLFALLRLFFLLIVILQEQGFKFAHVCLFLARDIKQNVLYIVAFNNIGQLFV